MQTLQLPHKFQQARLINHKAHQAHEVYFLSLTGITKEDDPFLVILRSQKQINLGDLKTGPYAKDVENLFFGALPNPCLNSVLDFFVKKDAKDVCELGYRQCRKT